MGTPYRGAMRIIAKGTLRDFWERFPDAEEPLLAWYREAEKADWGTPAKLKGSTETQAIVGDNRVVST